MLDYFNQQRKKIRDDHIIFNWEQSTELGHVRLLLVQVCADMGFPDPDQYLPLYLSEELSELMDFFPEFAYYRDIVYTFKFMMAPTAEAFPPVKPYLQKAAKLKWQFDVGKGTFTVRAFSKELVCMGPPPEKVSVSFITPLPPFWLVDSSIILIRTVLCFVAGFRNCLC